MGNAGQITLFISIHVPREGDDVVNTSQEPFQRTISIHVPREGDDTTHYFAVL